MPELETSQFSGFVEPPLGEALDAYCRVLLVDDNHDDQQLAKKRLMKSSAVEEVIFFNHGAELIKYLYDQGFQDRNAASLSPMVIVLDLAMPLMDGFSVLGELKSDSLLRDIPVIVVTGSQSADDLQRAFKLKADGIFRKPLDAGKLESFFKSGWSWPLQDIWTS